MGAVRLAGEVLPQDGRVGRHGLVRIDERRQFLVLDDDGLGAIGSGIAVLGDDECDFLILEQNFLMRQHGLHIARQRRHVVEVERDQVLRGQHRHHAGHGERRRFVDALDAGMAVRAAGEIAKQHAGQFQVVDIVAAALDKADILRPLALAANAFELLLTVDRGRVHMLVHHAASDVWRSLSAA